MAGGELVVAVNFITAASCHGIAYFIVRGLVHTRQLVHNHLAGKTDSAGLVRTSATIVHAILTLAGDLGRGCVV